MVRASILKLILLALLVPVLTTCSDDDRPADDPPPEDTLHYMVPFVVRGIPHENYQAREASTQGLLWYDGTLYESNGGASDINKTNIRTIDPSDGTVLWRVLLNNESIGFTPCGTNYCFGEGIALRNGRIVQLMWLNHFTLGWSVPALNYLGIEYNYEGPGWGLANTDTGFVMSNGSDTLYFRDDLFVVTNKLPVTLRASPLDSLNELEYVHGTMYANVLGRDSIYGIDLETGIVDRIVDCTNLVERVGLTDLQHALNGIAYDDTTGFFYVTGKDWPLIFEVMFVNK